MSPSIGSHERGPRSEPGIRQRIRYRFDNLLARGTSATLIWLGVVTLAAAATSGLLLALFGVTLSGGENTRWYEDTWQSAMRLLDPGTMAGDVGWGRRLLALTVTLFGLLVAGTLIGIIASGVEDRIDSMRRGRSVVIESDHVVVIGNSERLPELLAQLVLAGGEGGSRTIVVLADLDPSEMHRLGRDAAAAGRGGVRIVYRFGDPTSLDDLELVRLDAARGAIVLSDGRSDVAAIETVLGIAARRGGFDGLTVVVELLDPTNADLLHTAFGTDVQTLVPSQAIALTTAFALRRRGLSRFMAELLDFGGCDIHVVERPDLVGTTFGRLVVGFTHARPIGLLSADGALRISPSMDAVIERGDRIVLLADDTEALELTGNRQLTAPPTGDPPPAPVVFDERLVVIGWNDMGRGALGGWALTASPSSSVELLVDPRRVDPEHLHAPDLGSIPFVVTVCDDVIATVVDRRPTTIMILAHDGEPGAAGDVHAILDVHALRHAFTEHAVPVPRLVVEMTESVHLPLLDLTGPDDIVISDATGSHFLAQLVDQPLRRPVLFALYATDGPSVRLVRCDDFDLTGDHLVVDVVEATAARGALLIGWRRSEVRGAALTLNPPLDTRVRLEPGDELVVVA